ncbi:DDE-type integrase/transposase/recombinase [Candidatus Palauibacter sp.]|uniref:DDE-type integrase/transposase/recombinase n=1 Tax=Candidatus Palauibacter sp. TaxID=3101350 RepID=UPI003AF25F6F
MVLGYQRLLEPEKWRYFYLYVILDIFSRYATGWLVAERETAGLAGHLVGETCLKHGVEPRVLTLHSDRGSPMTAKCTAQILADLGVTQSLGRPRVSNDNPSRRRTSRPPSTTRGFPAGSFIEEAKDFWGVLPVVQHRTPARRHRPAHAGSRSTCGRPPR